MKRRNFLAASALLPLVQMSRAEEQCVEPLAVIAVENDPNTTVPFFEHYHLLLIPVGALIKLPTEGIKLQTTAVDQSSLNINEFNAFIDSLIANGQLAKDDLAGLEKFRTHSHSVSISQNQLRDLTNGKEITVNVISERGNHVHDFVVKASPSALARVSNGRA